MGDADQESFFDYMKDEIKDKILWCITYDEVKVIIDDWIDFYNNDRCIWHLNKMPPLEFYKSVKNKKNTFSLGEGQKQREYFIKHQFCLTTQNLMLKWFIQLSIPGLQPLYFGIKKGLTL